MSSGPSAPRAEISKRGPPAGHVTRQSLEIYSRLALADVKQRYEDIIGDFPSDQRQHARLGLVTRCLPHQPRGNPAYPDSVCYKG